MPTDDFRVSSRSTISRGRARPGTRARSISNAWRWRWGRSLDTRARSKGEVGTAGSSRGISRSSCVTAWPRSGRCAPRSASTSTWPAPSCEVAGDAWRPVCARPRCAPGRRGARAPTIWPRCSRARGSSGPAWARSRHPTPRSSLAEGGTFRDHVEAMPTDRDAIVEEAMWRGAIPERAGAEAAVEATLEALARCLTPADAASLAEGLPPSLGAVLARRGGPASSELEWLYERLAAIERIGLGLAVEHVRAAGEAIARSLGAERQLMLQRRLPPAWAE